MSDNKAAILTALKQLDPTNDDHWTSDGLPRLDVLAKAMHVSNVKRGDVTEAAPNFTKDNPTLEAPAAQGGDSTTGQGGEGAPTLPADQGEGEQAQEGEGSGDEGEGSDNELDDDISDIGGPVELDEAEAVVEAAKAKLAEAQEAQAAAKKVVDEAQAEVDRLITIRDSQRGPNADLEERLMFIKRQQEMRAARAGVSAELLKGIDVNKLDPRSPLDRSMARKTGFGHRPRPNLPLKKGE